MQRVQFRWKWDCSVVALEMPSKYITYVILYFQIGIFGHWHNKRPDFQQIAAAQPFFQLVETYFLFVCTCVCFHAYPSQTWRACTSCSAGFPMDWRPCVSAWAHTCGSKARPLCQRRERERTQWITSRYDSWLSGDFRVLQCNYSILWICRNIFAAAWVGNLMVRMLCLSTI